MDADLCAEGSLKLKEISYIHSEALPAGELKHGTISLMTQATPILALLTVPEVCEKTVSGIREVLARQAPVTAIVSDEVSRLIQIPCPRQILLPKLRKRFSMFPAATVMQLLAYETAKIRGNHIDQPRHLAKAVTVE